MARDAVSLAERVQGNTLLKALRVADHTIVARLTCEPGRVYGQVEGETPPDSHDLRAAQAAAVRMFGLQTDPTAFERLVRQRPELSGLIAGRAGLRIPLSADVFEGIAWAIIGQQINLTFAYHLRRALIDLCGTPATGGLKAHPTPHAVAALEYADLTARQFSRRKAEYLIDTARLLAGGTLRLDPQAAAPEMEQRLLAVRGLGPWSVGYIMMRALGYPDCVPFGDTGLTSALQRFFSLPHRPTTTETAHLMSAFAPYRSLATYHLWMVGGALRLSD
jgi:3-methyladenine DNA glycosylase/8-oxoguanine DNA glycosylase